MARILVIDDEANIRMMLRMALERERYTVGLAADGPEGLEEFGDGSAWDLVLLDKRLPGMDGLEVLGEMQRRQPKTRIIMITAFGTVDLVREAARHGANDFLRKPFTLDTLRDAVAAALLEEVLGPHAPIQSTAPGAPVTLTTFNGYRLETLRHPAQRKHGDIRQMLTIRCPNGDMRTCEVILQPELIARIHEDTGLQRAAEDETFWQGLCEEALLDYLWQNARIPFGGVLRVDEYSTLLRRWVVATVAHSGDPQEHLASR